LEAYKRQLNFTALLPMISLLGKQNVAVDTEITSLDNFVSDSVL